MDFNEPLNIINMFRPSPRRPVVYSKFYPKIRHRIYDWHTVLKTTMASSENPWYISFALLHRVGLKLT
jgi:hypothetical protein